MNSIDTGILKVGKLSSLAVDLCAIHTSNSGSTVPLCPAWGNFNLLTNNEWRTNNVDFFSVSLSIVRSKLSSESVKTASITILR